MLILAISFHILAMSEKGISLSIVSSSSDGLSKGTTFLWRVRPKCLLSMKLFTNINRQMVSLYKAHMYCSDISS